MRRNSWVAWGGHSCPPKLAVNRCARDQVSLSLQKPACRTVQADRSVRPTPAMRSRNQITAGAIEGTRTPTPLRVHGPEPCASANSATMASGLVLQRRSHYDHRRLRHLFLQGADGVSNLALSRRAKALGSIAIPATGSHGWLRSR